MLPGGIGIGEMVVIGIVAVLLFGSRLPEVAKSLGASYQQFRKGLSDIQSSIKTDLNSDSTISKSRSTVNRRLPDYSDYNNDYQSDLEEPATPKFVPPSEDDEA